jgi:hypothetical protein
MTVKKEAFEKEKTVKERYDGIKEKIKQADGFWKEWSQVQSKDTKMAFPKITFGYRFVENQNVVFSEKYEDFGLDK